MNKKGVVSFALTIAAGYHTLDSISTNDPRTKREVSVRLTLESLESGSFRTKIRDENIVRRVLRKCLHFHCRAEDVSTISKYPVAPNHSGRGYVNGKYYP